MKTEIHPKYQNTKIKCACGNEIETKSTVFPEIHIELCSACHPFFTGKQKFIDTAGRVDKFRARVEKAASLKSQEKKTGKREETGPKSNTEKLAEIKKELNTEPKPMAVDQTETSSEEIAAADELAHEKTKKEVTDLDKTENQ